MKTKWTTDVPMPLPVDFMGHWYWCKYRWYNTVKTKYQMVTCPCFIYRVAADNTVMLQTAMGDVFSCWPSPVSTSTLSTKPKGMKFGPHIPLPD